MKKSEHLEEIDRRSSFSELFLGAKSCFIAVRWNLMRRLRNLRVRESRILSLRACCPVKFNFMGKMNRKTLKSQWTI